MSARHHTMEKKIAKIRYKMITLISLILLLGTWQHHFILEGVRAHVEMNSTILGTFAFSIVVAFVFVFKLNNEMVAFNALKEMWEDIQHGPAESSRDPLWKFRRCGRPAQVFQRPRLLGHAYELVTGEVARTKKIRVSVETMNTLVHTIEQSINEEKSMIVYLSGLLVFMGLIGTFIGLLQMVGAIGGIIGSLAQSAGGAGATGAFQELLGALQEPLKGMASGFASSLFGLFSSLVVGLLGRFAGQAANVLKGEFESWLAGVVQFGEDGQTEPASAALAAAPNDAALVGLIGKVMADYAKVSGSFGLVARRLEEMQATQALQSQVAERLLVEFTQMRHGQAQISDRLAATAQIPHAIDELGARMTHLGETVAERVQVDVAGLRGAMEEMNRSQTAALRVVSSHQLQAATYMAGAVDQLSAEIERRASAPSGALLEASIERGLAKGVAEIGQVMRRNADRDEARMARFEQAHADVLHEIARSAASGTGSSEANHLAAKLEQSLGDRLEHMNETVSTAFSAYSSLLHVAMSSLQQAGHAREVEQARLQLFEQQIDEERQRLERLVAEKHRLHSGPVA